MTHAVKPVDSCVAPGQSATGTPFLYQVRCELLARNVKVSRIGAATSGPSVTEMSIVQVAPLPHPSLGFDRRCSISVSGVQNRPVGPVRPAVVISGLAVLSPLRVASAASPAWTQLPAASAVVGTTVRSWSGAGNVSVWDLSGSLALSSAFSNDIR